jgi:hypothetical protein
MLRRRATPFIERHIAARKTWHEPPKPMPGMPVVRIDELLLAGRTHEPDHLDDIAAQVHQQDFPEGFEDENPEKEIQQVRIPLELLTTTEMPIAMPAHVIFHEGNFWVSQGRFFGD